MRFRAFLSFAATLFFASVLFAQTENTPTPEDTAFRGIMETLSKSERSGANPAEDNYKAKREAGLDAAAKAKQFLKDYPNSKNADDAQSLWNLGLMQAAVVGDDDAAAQLDARATEIIKDPKAPDMLKLHEFCVNHITKWARKNGKRDFGPDSPDSQKAYMEALFAAAEVLPNKEDIFKMLLLQAKAGREFSDEEKQKIAQRVLDSAGAPDVIKALARQILSREKSYAVGKPLDLSFVAMDGKKINLADLKGKVVLIDFWATWCGPCVGEMPTVKKTYDKYHAQGFEILGISLDDDKDALLRFLKKNEIAWPQYFDGKHWNNDVSFRFGINSVPAEWLIDKKGILRSTDVRGNLEQVVGALLQEK